MTLEERLMQVLASNRYEIKHLADWLHISYQGAWKKVKGITQWTYSDMLTIKQKLGTKNLNYIFFS